MKKETQCKILSINYKLFLLLYFICLVYLSLFKWKPKIRTLFKTTDYR